MDWIFGIAAGICNLVSLNLCLVYTKNQKPAVELLVIMGSILVATIVASCGYLSY